jgi:hypothetical protein
MGVGMRKIRSSAVQNGLALLTILVLVVIVGAPFLGLGSNEQFVLYRAFGVSRTVAVKITISILLVGLISVMTYRSAPLIRTKSIIAARNLRTKSIIAARNLRTKSIIAARNLRTKSIIAARNLRTKSIIVAHNLRTKSIVAARNLRAEIIVTTSILFGVRQKSMQAHEQPKAAAIDCSYFLCVLFNLICFAGVMYISFFRNRGHIFAGLDGSYILTLVKGQAMWAPLGLGFSANPLQSLGNIWFALNTQLFPAYVVPIQFFGIEAIGDAKFHALSYTIFASELFLATLLVGRAVGFGGTASILGAWFAPLLLFPLLGRPRLYPILGVSPHLATCMSEALLLTVLFGHLGRNGRWIRDSLFVFLAIILTGHLIVSQPFAVLLCAPILLVMVVGLGAGAEARREIITKIFGFGLVALILSISGFLFFLVGMFKDSATFFWANEFTRFGTTAYELSILFQTEAWGYSSVGLYCLALLGIVNCVLTACRRLSRFAVTVVGTIVLLFGFGGLMLVFDVWRGPTSVYFEIFLVPIYALFAMHFVVVVTVRLVRHFAGAKVRAKMWFGNPFVMGGVIALLIILVSSPNDTRYFPFPPLKTPLIATLGELVAASPGAPFRGRVATFQAQDVHGKSGWLELHGLDSARMRAVGNDYHMVGMWFYEVPTLIEYSPAISPAFYRAATYLLARPGDAQVRNGLVVRRIVPSVLALLGVRYVVTNVPQPAPLRFMMSEQTTADETLYLYEVPNPNLGTWGVIDSRKVKSFDAALDAIADPNFDPARTAILIDGVEKGDVSPRLVPVDSASLKISAGGLWVEAASPGTSLLVVPFEFSRCLNVDTQLAGAAAPRLLRVNALETGVLFTGRIQAEIRYFTGPFHNADCRIRDAAEFSKLIGR